MSQLMNKSIDVRYRARNFDELTELIADRERLSGKDRQRFVARLRRVGNRTDRARRRAAYLVIVFVTLTPFIVNYIFSALDKSITMLGWLKILPYAWVPFGVLGGILILRRLRIRKEFREEWEKYCKVVRSYIIEAMPGVLDQKPPE